MEISVRLFFLLQYDFTIEVPEKKSSYSGKCMGKKSSYSEKCMEKKSSYSGKCMEKSPLIVENAWEKSPRIVENAWKKKNVYNHGFNIQIHRRKVLFMKTSKN